MYQPLKLTPHLCNREILRLSTKIPEKISNNLLGLVVLGPLIYVCDDKFDRIWSFGCCRILGCIHHNFWWIAGSVHHNYCRAFTPINRFIDLINDGLKFLENDLYTEAKNKFINAIKLNAEIIDVNYLKKIDFGNLQQNLYKSFLEDSKNDSLTNQYHNLFLDRKDERLLGAQNVERLC